MPKTNYCKLPNQRQEEKRVLKACIESHKALYGISDAMIATRLRIVERTFRNYLEKESFTLPQLREMAKMLHFTPIEMASIVSGDVLTTKNLKDFGLLMPVRKAVDY